MQNNGSISELTQLGIEQAQVDNTKSANVGAGLVPAQYTDRQNWATTRVAPTGTNQMAYDTKIHRRRSLRLKGYDYTGAGAYFVTIVTQSRSCLFGEIVGEEMRLNEAGEMIRTVWEALPRRFPGIEIEGFVVMPNHLHGIIAIHQPVGAGLVPAQDTNGQSTEPTDVGALPKIPTTTQPRG